MKENYAAKLKGEEGSTLQSVHQCSRNSGCLGFYLQVMMLWDSNEITQNLPECLSVWRALGAWWVLHQYNELWFAAAPGYLPRYVQMCVHTVTWTCWLHGWLPGCLDSCLWGGLRVTMATEEHQPLCLSEEKELSCHLNPLSFSPSPL